MTNGKRSITARNRGVVTVGSINIDVAAFCDRLPRAGQTVLGTSVSLTLGGKGANQAVAVARAGSESFLVGGVGDDLYGQLATESLTNQGVDIKYVSVNVHRKRPPAAPCVTA